MTINEAQITQLEKELEDLEELFQLLMIYLCMELIHL